MRTDIAIAYHLGAPSTDILQLFRSLRKDVELLKSNSIIVRRPRDCRDLIDEAVKKNGQKDATPDEQELLLSSLTNQQPIGRLVLVNTQFLGVQSWMFNHALFYHNAGLRTNELRHLFPDNPCEFFLAIKNPATFVPVTFADQNTKNYTEFIAGMDLENIRWTRVIERVLQANPDCPITVWCTEDTPIIWSAVLGQLTAADQSTVFNGDLDILSQIMSPDGFARMEQYLAERPTLNEMQRRRVKSVFLEKFVLEDAVDIEIDLPDWTEDLVDRITENYDEDVAHITRMSDVNFISP